jgi:signal-transduction protein with cAMP-binding, CBS, and nucleotidyltransferase domain
MEKLLAFFLQEHPSNREGLEDFLACFEMKQYPKNTLLLKDNTIENELRFLYEGTVREYYASEALEKNINFYTESSFITDFPSFFYNKPTHKYQEALSHVVLYTLGKAKFLSFLGKYPCGKNFIDTIFQKLLERKELDILHACLKSPEELYQELLVHRKKWLQQIPQYHIASYLGITPETLSRIRKRIS